jgi:hypothetical protein
MTVFLRENAATLLLLRIDVAGLFDGAQQAPTRISRHLCPTGKVEVFVLRPDQGRYAPLPGDRGLPFRSPAPPLARPAR